MDIPFVTPTAPRFTRAHVRSRHGSLVLALAWPLAALAQAGAPPGEPGLDAAAQRQIEALGEQAGAALAGAKARIEIEAGRLDPRLRLAPCGRIEAHLPAGARAWGRTRVGLRCVEGATPWNVYLPVTVKVFAPGWVAVAALPAGTVLREEQLQLAEVDWAAERTPPLADPQQALGRSLARPLAAGQPLRQGDLAQRQWFAAGDKVQLLARGAGFSVSGEGQALAAGVEGRPVRVRTDSGQVLSGIAVGTNRVEVQL